MGKIRRSHMAGKGPGPEQLAEIEAAASRPVTYDKDCPKLSDAQLAEFAPIGMTWEERAAAIMAAPSNYRPIKKTVNVRLDADVIEWLKKDGAGYQTRMNSILRQVMESNV